MTSKRKPKKKAAAPAPAPAPAAATPPASTTPSAASDPSESAPPSARERQLLQDLRAACSFSEADWMKIFARQGLDSKTIRALQEASDDLRSSVLVTEAIDMLAAFVDKWDVNLSGPVAGSQTRGKLTESLSLSLSLSLSFSLSRDVQRLWWPPEPFTMMGLMGPAPALLLFLDKYRWALAQLQRYAKPTRLGEGAENCRKMAAFGALHRSIKGLDGPNLTPAQARVAHCQADSQLYLYEGVARALAGDQDEAAREVLEMALQNRNLEVGKRNPVWASSHLARVLRRLGDIEAAEKVEKDVVKHIKNHPNLFSPNAMAEMFLVNGEVSTPLMDKIAAKKITGPEMNERQLKKADNDCYKCHKHGVGVKLSTCSKCSTAKYCSADCQRAHWPDHKESCKFLAALKDAPVATKTGISSAEREYYEIKQEFESWGHLMRPVVAEIAPSALGLFKDYDRIKTMALHVRARRNVTTAKSDGLDRFQITGADVVKKQDLIDRNIVSQKQIDAFTSHRQNINGDQICLVVISGFSNQSNVIFSAVSRSKMEQKKYHENWLAVLQAGKATPGYDFE